MSQPNFDPMGQAPAESPVATAPTIKRSLDIYTLMLLIAAIAMLLGTVLLFIELSRWGSFSELPWNTTSANPNLQVGG